MADLLGPALWQLLVDLSHAFAGLALVVGGTLLLFFLDSREEQ